jgi:hypothetical protein
MVQPKECWLQPPNVVFGERGQEFSQATSCGYLSLAKATVHGLATAATFVQHADLTSLPPLPSSPLTPNLRRPGSLEVGMGYCFAW